MNHVPEPHRLRNTLITISAFVCVAVVLAMMIKLPESVSGSCLIDPGQHWTLSELRPGSYKTVTDDLLAGEMRHYRVYQFDRPSFVDFSLAAGSGREGMVSAGEVLAIANSTSLSIELIERQADLAEALSELEILQAGSKTAVLKHAELSIKSAQAELAAYLVQYDRQKNLHKQEVLSSEDWEAFESRLDILTLDVQLAQARLDELSTGDTPEKIERSQVNITSMERELAAVQEMIDALEIRTPISGRLSLQERSGSLLSVSNSDTMIARILIAQGHAQKPVVGQPLQIVVPGYSNENFIGEVLRIDPQITLTGAGPFITVYGILDNSDGRLVSGMMGRAKILGQTTSLWDQFKKECSTVIRQEIWPR